MEYANITEISGFVGRIYYPKNQNSKEKKSNSYYIFKFQTITPRKDVMVKGHFPGANIYQGLQLKLHGKFDFNNQYKNWEFATNNYEELAPGSAEDLISYLSNYVRYIGPSKAKKLVEHFGENLIDEISENPDLLDECKFLKKRQKDSLIEEFSTSKKFRDAALFLQKFRLTSSKIQKVIDILGENTKHQLGLNPYLLVDFGICSFEKCDRVALSESFSINAEERIRACIVQVLKDSCFENGHLYLTLKQLYQAISIAFKSKYTQKFYLDPKLLKEFLVLMHADEKIHIQKSGSDLLVYPKLSYEAEAKSAEKLAKILQNPPLYEEYELKEWVENYQKNNNIELTTKQKEAIMLLSKGRVMVISGNPGTGKSFLVKTFSELFKRDNRNFSLLAPTGVAAKNLNTITGEPSGTIHRKLQWAGRTEDERDIDKSFGTSWGYNSTHQYPAEIVLVDELSMIDQYVFYRLTDALKDDAILILIGDPDQLESVSPGSVLADLEGCPDIPSIRLDEVKRQDSISDIITVANKINQGSIVARSNMTEEHDVTFIDAENDSDILEKVLEQVTFYKGHPDLQVITPMYKSQIGVTNLNNLIREISNPLTLAMSVSNINDEMNIRDYDKIIVTKNNYKKVIFNGEGGYIVRVSPDSEEVEVLIGGIETPFLLSFKEVEEFIQLAYCLTVHKVQGNEYDMVIIPISNTFYNMLQRNLIYTAITRAKSKVILVGQYSAFCRAIANNETQLRNSKLGRRISIELKKLSTV